MENLKPLIVEVVIGIILLGTSFFIKSDYYSTMIFSMGIGLTAGAAAQIIRIIYWKNPKRQDAYEAKKREAHINRIDERKQYLRMKAGHITYQIMTFLLLLLAFILSVFEAEAWIIVMIFLLFVFQWLVSFITYRILEKKI